MEWKNQVQTGTMQTVIEGMTSLSDNSELRIILNNGHQLLGTPLRCDTKNGMFLFEIRTNPPAEIAWIPFSSVCYIHLVNPAASMKGITGGKITRDPNVSGIPSLELKRKVAKTFEGMKPQVEIQWPQTLTGPDSLGISDFAEALQEVLTSLQADTAGKEALAGIQKISVLTTGELSASAAQGILTINFPAPNFDRGMKNQLLATIEKAL